MSGLLKDPHTAIDPSSSDRVATADRKNGAPMRVLYAESTGEVELSATVAELHRLAQGLRKVQGAFVLDSHIDATPYDRALSSIETMLTSVAPRSRWSAIP
jgi:hypothetical protein